ncbi:neurosecretory protein VGF [Huso huso]|uniref:Neurosecretory protein VGF n=1 Tax=Huso huso TaxID=61971 RepID=A0ABR0Y1A8_HUSHU
MTWSCYRGCAVSLLLSVTLALLAHGAPVTENKAPREDDVGMEHDGMTRLPDPLHELNQETPQLPRGGDKEVQTRSLSRPSPARLGPKEQGGEEGKQEEELFKDIDPKTLAAVLIEALNQGGEQEEGEGGKQRKGGGGGKGGEEVLALLGRQQQEEAAERREEEERLTERVKSRTRSGPGGQEKEKPRGESSSWGKPAADPPSEEKEEEEEEGEEKHGVLTEQELENLEATLREMQRHSVAGEREREREREKEREKEREEEKERERAAVASLGKGRGSWADSGEDVRELAAFRGLVQRGGESQEEEEEERERKAPQPRLYHPRFRSEEDEEEAALDAEEEAEQEEVRRQAAEAQRAREEEEKLADVASDLLLQYLTKQGGGAREQEREEGGEELEERHSHSNNPHHRQDQRKKNYLLEDNAAEDKRSNEVEVRDEQDDDDLDPQTIDRLIEISSKLHLPADDVVDIITDVEEKKKKKDSAPEPRGRPAPNPAPKPAFHHALNPNTAGRFSSARAPPGRLQVELQRDFKQKTAPEKQQQYPKQKAFMHKASSMYYPRYQPPSYNQELSVNDILGNSLDYEESWPAPWRYRPQQQQQQLERESYPIPNYIQALRPPPQPRRHFYYPMATPREQQGGDYYQDTRDKEEELENFIEKILLEHPEVFQ